MSSSNLNLIIVPVLHPWQRVLSTIVVAGLFSSSMHGEKGFLCRDPSDCRRVASARFALESEGTVWFWRDPAWERLAVIAATTDLKVDLSSNSFRVIPISFRPAPDKVWDVAEIGWIETGQTSSVRVPRNAIEKVKFLSVPVGTTEIRITVPHHRPFTLTLSTDLRVDLKPVVAHLKPFPLLTGKIIRKEDGQPLMGALIDGGLREIEAESDAAGFFQLEVPAEWPASLNVSSSGRGKKIIALPTAESDVSVGTIAMAVAGRLTIETNASKEVTIELFAVPENGRAESVSRVIATADKPEVSVVDIAPGSYEVSLTGAAPLERLVERVEISAGEDKRIAIDIAPIELQIRVERKDDGVPGARLTLLHVGASWTAEAITDGTGNLDTPVWQAGEFAVGVESEPSAAFSTTFTVDAPGPRIETIVLPASKVRVSIFGAQSGMPVPHAQITLETPTGVQSHELGDNAQFTFEALREGEYFLRAMAPGHLPTEEAFRISDRNEEKSVKIVMSEAEIANVVVHDYRGEAVVGAFVYTNPPNPELSWITDDRGIVEVPLQKAMERELFILPRNGSFVIGKVKSEGSETQRSPVLIVVPRGEATIRVDAQTESGEPLADLSFFVRVKGRMLPPSLLDIMAVVHGNRFRTNAEGSMLLRNLPQGVYEFWPFFSPDEAARILGELGPAAPVQIGARAGENYAKLTFRRVKP